MTNFIIASAQEAAMDIISRHNVLQLSPRDQQIFIDGLLNPPAPNEALRAAAARYNAILGHCAAGEELLARLAGSSSTSVWPSTNSPVGRHPISRLT